MQLKNAFRTSGITVINSLHYSIFVLELVDVQRHDNTRHLVEGEDNKDQIHTDEGGKEGGGRLHELALQNDFGEHIHQLQNIN